MRCKACDSIEAHYIHHWEDWYCDECLEAIRDAIDDDEEDLDYELQNL